MRRPAPIAAWFVVPLLLAAAGFPPAAHAATWHVLPDGTGDAPTIQAAVDSSAAGDSILVAAGTYLENVVIEPGRILIGSWDEGFAVSDLELHPTTVDGDSAGACITADFAGQQDPAGRISGFVLTNGSGLLRNDGERYGGALYADGLWNIRDVIVEDSHAFSGAGAYVTADNPALVNVIARLNTLGYLGPDGSGLHLEAGEAATIDSCRFESNWDWFGPVKGLGLSVFGPRVEITRSEVVEQETYTTSCVYGVGIYSECDSLIVTDCLIANNNWIDWPGWSETRERTPEHDRGPYCEYDAFGGGVYAAGATRIERSLIYRNGAHGWYYALGGGLHLESGVIRDCVLSENIALGSEDDGYGGAIYGGSITVENCEIRGNKAGGYRNGVACAIDADVLTVRNTIITGNRSHASYHARTIVRAATLTMTNTTVALNSVYRGNPWEDTVVAIEADGGTVSHCILSGNSVNHEDDAVIVGGISGAVASDYNLFWNNTGQEHDGLVSESHTVRADPLLADSTLHLALHSPAIDRGDPSILDPDGSRADLGAYGGPGADMAQPAHATGLSATRTPAGIELEWDANGAPDLAGYAIYRLASMNDHPSLESFLARTTDTAFLDPIGPPWPQWSYRVSAYDLDTYGGGYSEAVVAASSGPVRSNAPAPPELRRLGTNPSSGPVTFGIRSPTVSPARIDIFDVQGRRVWTRETTLPSGPSTLRWPTTDSAGRAVPSGIYFVQIGFAGESYRRKVMVVR